MLSHAFRFVASIIDVLLPKLTCPSSVFVCLSNLKWTNLVDFDTNFDSEILTNFSLEPGFIFSGGLPLSLTKLLSKLLLLKRYKKKKTFVKIHLYSLLKCDLENWI